MRITQESDDALRIVTALALSGGIMDAKDLAKETSVTPSFTLKILHKLLLGGIVISHKGANGGYSLSVSADRLTMKDVIEVIEGPMLIARCLCSHEECTRGSVNKADCRYHHIFRQVSEQVANTFADVRIADVIADVQGQ